MKYSINSAGNIVAERDIYSLGGFIPKGSVGAKVANGDQISQDGECWVAKGDISSRPDVRVRDNAYVGEFTDATTVHTDGITEFSGDTLVPGRVVVRNPVADPKNNFFCKDSLIGISMDVLCGPGSTTTAAPFEQGAYDTTAAKGTLFENMVKTPVPADICRAVFNFRCGKETYLYLPGGLNVTILWGYFDTSGKLAYAGGYSRAPAGLIKLEHPIYKTGRIIIEKPGDQSFAPEKLLASGAKILGCISDSTFTDIRPESVSGSYVMDNSGFIINTDNFGLAATQLRFLAGGMYNTNMYTSAGTLDHKPYGTFRNVGRLEYDQYFVGSYRNHINRDRFISAYDCPLVRIGEGFVTGSLVIAGGLTLRRCIVPKGMFENDTINGNVYEDIDFSYANEEAGSTIAGYAAIKNSHKQGLYRLTSGDITNGLVSSSANLVGTGRIFPGIEDTPLDGNLIEKGAYTGTIGHYYEDDKKNASNRVRTGTPLSTEGLTFPSMPSGYQIVSIYYLDESFRLMSDNRGPSSISTLYPYAVFEFSKGTNVISASEFIALGLSLTYDNYNTVPEITGSAYIGAGCTIRGDVQLHGDPYVNRVLDVNLWERGNSQPVSGGKWQDGFFSSTAFNRFRSKDLIPVEPGGTISRPNGGKLVAWFFDGDKKRTASSGTGWVTSFVVPENVSYVGMAADVNGDGLVTEGDIAAAGIKYVRAFRERRYITNELDRVSPEDILLSVDYWENGTVDNDAANAGKPIKDIMLPSLGAIRLKIPVNYTKPTKTIAGGFAYSVTSYDAGTKYFHGMAEGDGRATLKEVVLVKSPSANILPSDAATARAVIRFVPAPRIVTPYGIADIWVQGTKVRMYDNSVISKTITAGGDVTLKDDAVMGSIFTGDVCTCSNGHDDAIIKMP